MSEDFLGLTARMKIRTPNGVVLRGDIFHAQIFDGKTSWWFNDYDTTKYLAEVLEDSYERTGSEETHFFAEKKVGVTLYPGKLKEDIKDKLIRELEAMGGRIYER